MSAIGILGFIVWAHVKGLSYCEIRVRIFAICVNCFLYFYIKLLYIKIYYTLVGTLNSKNSTNNTQYAGKYVQYIFSFIIKKLYTSLKNKSISSETTSEKSFLDILLAKKNIFIFFLFHAKLFIFNRQLSLTHSNHFNKDFDFFNNYRISLGMKPIDHNWLYWFIGFSEGDGALLIYKNNIKYV